MYVHAYLRGATQAALLRSAIRVGVALTPSATGQALSTLTANISPSAALHCIPFQLGHTEQPKHHFILTKTLCVTLIAYRPGTTYNSETNNDDWYGVGAGKATIVCFRRGITLLLRLVHATHVCVSALDSAPRALGGRKAIDMRKWINVCAHARTLLLCLLLCLAGHTLDSTRVFTVVTQFHADAGVALLLSLCGSPHHATQRSRQRRLSLDWRSDNTTKAVYLIGSL